MNRYGGTVRPMRVLVTGGGGFIGSHLAEQLLADGHDVRVLDSFVTGRRENIAHLPDVDLVEGDVQSYERVNTAVRGCEVVLHQAALPSVPRSVQDPLTTTAVNVTGTLNVLLASRDAGVRRVIYASSSSVYGAGPELPKREAMATVPISPYAVSKLAAEGFCRSFAGIYGLETVSLRYFNVFGPRQDPNSEYAAVIPRWIELLLDGGRPLVHGDGETTRDFTFVGNVVQANLLAMMAGDVSGEVFNAACGDRISLNQVLAQIGEVLGVDVEAEHGPARPGDVPHSHADVGKARELLGYEPTVSIAEGLERTIDDLVRRREQRQIRSA